jgi:hypothetical protein
VECVYPSKRYRFDSSLNNFRQNEDHNSDVPLKCLIFRCYMEISRKIFFGKEFSPEKFLRTTTNEKQPPKHRVKHSEILCLSFMQI